MRKPREARARGTRGTGAMEGIHGERFDAVVVGTGTAECMLAAALATSGRRVLHVDQVGAPAAQA